MAVTSIGGPQNGQNLKHPQFYSQKWPTKTATKSLRFLLYFSLFFLNFFVLLSLFLFLSCCFMTFWNPKASHQMRLQATKCTQGFSKTRRGIKTDGFQNGKVVLCFNRSKIKGRRTNRVNPERHHENPERHQKQKIGVKKEIGSQCEIEEERRQFWA